MHYSVQKTNEKGTYWMTVYEDEKSGRIQKYIAFNNWEMKKNKLQLICDGVEEMTLKGNEATQAIEVIARLKNG